MRGTNTAVRYALVATASLSLSVFVGCGPSVGGGGDDASSGPDANHPTRPDANPGGGGPDANPGGGGNFNVYAHGDHILYMVDLQAKTLQEVGPFHAPQVMVGNTMAEDVITDLAVGPDNTIWVISETALYTADPNDGHVTKVGNTAACGQKTVALTATPQGQIWAGDYAGHVCQVDTTTNPPTMHAPVTLSGGYALTGDMVAVGDGTVFGTAYKPVPANDPTNTSNELVTIDLPTGQVTPIGATGYPKLFGASYAGGQVFGFTHDGTGHVVTIDRTTGAGTLFATFTDPTTHMGIRFAGAGVNSTVVVGLR